jgi:hypothetical protein
MVTKAQERKNAKAAAERRNKRAAFFTILGLAAGFGCPAYFMLAADPSFYFGLVLLWACGIFLIIAFLELFNSWKVKIPLALAVVLVASVGSVWAKSEWMKKIEADVKAHLAIGMSVPVNGETWDSLITLKNGSGTALQRYEVNCRINYLKAGMVMSGISNVLTRPDERLEPGGDGETQGCLTRDNGTRMITGALPISCADITVSVNFSADSSPSIAGIKEMRFVYGFIRGQSWVQQPVSRSGTYCRS